MDNENIYQLELHAEIKVADNLWCRRVPSGWIYSDAAMSDEGHCVFVPFNNEFQKTEKEKK